MKYSRATTFGSLAVLFLAAAGITAATFYSLITPDYRGKTFYQALGGCWLAELIFAACLAFTLVAGLQSGAPGQATRRRLLTWVAGWAVVIIAGSAVAVAPRYADSFYSDKILIWQLIFTFFVAAGACLLQRQAAVVEATAAEPQRQRTKVQSYASGVEVLLPRIRDLSAKQPAKATQVDQLCRRVDTLRVQLLSSLPVGERAGGRLVDPPAPELVEDRLRQLHDQVDLLCGANAASINLELEKTRQAVDAAVAALRQRRDAGLR